jgi:hypothetical protein
MIVSTFPMDSKPPPNLQPRLSGDNEPPVLSKRLAKRLYPATLKHNYNCRGAGRAAATLICQKLEKPIITEGL